MRIALSVGSNLGDREAALRAGVDAVVALPGVSNVRVSPIYQTDPVGGVEQPDFLNLVVVADADRTDIQALADRLLALAQQVEADLARVREVRWGPRTVDVDILAVADLRSEDPNLTVPHPRIAERAFVLVPWSDVDPGFEVPGMGIVADLRDALPADEVAGVRPWPAEPENR